MATVFPTKVEIPEKKYKTFEQAENEYLTFQNETLCRKIIKLEKERKEYDQNIDRYKDKYDEMIECIRVLQFNKEELIKRVRELEKLNYQYKDKIEQNERSQLYVNRKLEEVNKECDERINKMKKDCDNIIQNYLTHAEQLEKEFNNYYQKAYGKN